MRAKLEFDLTQSEDRHDFTVATQAHGIRSVLVDLLEQLKRVAGTDAPEASYAGQLRKQIYMDLVDEDVTIID